MHRRKRILSLIVLGMAGLTAYQFSTLSSHKSTPLNTSSECLEGREAAMLQGGVIDTMNSPPKPGCPGYEEVSEGDIGTYQLGPYTFRIPRDYLIYGKYREGIREMLSMYIEFPSMLPALKQLEEAGYNNELHVSLIYDNDCPSTPCESRSLNFYRVLTNMEQNYIHKESGVKKSEIQGFLAYQFNAGTETFQDIRKVYIRGEYDNPDEWYVCRVSSPSPACETQYKLDTGLFVKLVFSYSNIVNTKDIRQKLRELLMNRFLRGE